MAEDKFNMPLSSYEELVKVIRAYGSVSQPSSLEDVSKSVGLHRTIISRNAGFLIGIGLLEAWLQEDGDPTWAGARLSARHEIPMQIRDSWRRAIQQTDFFKKLITAVRIRKGMDQSTFEAHIAYSAGQPKKPSYMTGAHNHRHTARSRDDT